MEQIKVGLIEDQKLFREGIKVLINSDSELNVMFESPDGFSVLDRLKETSAVPDVMLIDLNLPRKERRNFDGWRVLSLLNENYPEMRKLILSVSNDPYVISKIIGEEGAHGYLTKDVEPEEVIGGIKSAHRNGSYIDERALLAIQSKIRGVLNVPRGSQYEDLSLNLLTKREIEVVQHVAKGLTTSEISETLFISEKTVNGHRNNILQKTGCRNAAGLVMYAVKHGIVEIE
ncbi:MAG: LuxR C-terminal-related transcriptional regulator [Crocinitomicaceae bacterium]